MSDRLGPLRIRTGGPFTLASARKAGFEEPEIRRLIRTEQWVRMRRGVYVEARLLTEAAGNPHHQHALDAAALILALGHPALAGFTSAARMLGLEFLTPPPEQIVLLSSHPAVKGVRRDGYAVRRTAALPLHHRQKLFGVGLISAARTLVDLAGELPFKDAVVLVDSALRRGSVTMHEIEAVLRDRHVWPRIRLAQDVVAFADPAAESGLESLSRVVFREAGLPPPRTQVWISDDMGPFAKVDFAWDEFKVIGEADGLAKYEAEGWRTTRDIVRAEKEREEMLFDAGWEVVRWGWDLANDSERLGRRLRAAFRRGAERQRGRSTPRS